MPKSYRPSLVIPHLWVGPEPKNVRGLGRHFDTLVLTAKEIQYASRFPDIEVIKAPLDDTEFPPTEDEIVIAYDAALRVARKVSQGKDVLVTCHLGRNRSGMVAALAMRMLGYGPKETVNKLRGARGDEALRNPWFEQMVVRY